MNCFQFLGNRFCTRSKALDIEFEWHGYLVPHVDPAYHRGPSSRVWDVMWPVFLGWADDPLRFRVLVYAVCLGEMPLSADPGTKSNPSPC